MTDPTFACRIRRALRSLIRPTNQKTLYFVGRIKECGA